ncbi:uncharacterized protein C8N26_1832 [Tenacibaculum lutimaris]|uniref:TPM domain-containing protein n=1 Tax=Tenacibaculum lutimaris TaxID=285258 RepID=A0A420E0J6_9FLAO|nr:MULTISPECIES: TPM domain-containing protein [Tenacibaculum]NVK09972.1 TPM domain-containing protein [Tenacibaculum sp.]RKF03447.1 uncharacterized protein C8N26_1832 [Tenacibaculum lutimaris]
MKKEKVIIILLLIITVFSCKSRENEKEVVFFNKSKEVVQSKFPFPIGYVNDYEDVFTKEEEEKLEKLIDDYEKESTNVIAVVTISSYDPYKNIEDYSLALANDWGVGRKDKNNGLTIVINKLKREIRISTGLGTEKTLTDEICKKVIDSIIIPEFKNENYYEGVEKGIRSLIKQW